MTLQYDQSNINLLDGRPISLQTPDATVVNTQVGAIRDGEVLVATLFGGGADADESLITTNNYNVITGVGTFTRVAGTGAVQPGPIVLVAVGAAIVLSFTVADTATQTICNLTFNGPAFPYNHRLKVSTVTF